MNRDTPWRLSPQVSVRPEPFGALLYHFGTRKLSFLKDRTLLAIVESLDRVDSLDEACEAAGVDPRDRERYFGALETLAGSAMIEQRTT